MCHFRQDTPLRTLASVSAPGTLRSRLIALGLVFAAVPLFAACGGDDDSAVAASATADPSASPTRAAVALPSLTGTGSHDSPSLDTPASKYSIIQDDLPEGFITYIPGTYVLDTDDYAASKIFVSTDEGKALLNQWGYLGGYETSYTPEGRERAVLAGAYYFAVETHLFDDESGAEAAYQHFHQKLTSSASTMVETAPLGNESTAWARQGDVIRGSSVPSLLHTVVFRRGNLLAVVSTFGAQPFMTVETSVSLATIVDEKALGERDAIEPTPTSNFTPQDAASATSASED